MDNETDETLYLFSAKIYPKKKKRDAISELSIKIINPLIEEREILPIWERLLQEVFGKKKVSGFTVYRPRSPEEALLSSEEKEERTCFLNRTIKVIRANGIESYYESLPEYLKQFIEYYYWNSNSSTFLNVKPKYTKKTETKYRGELLHDDKTFNSLFVDVIMEEVGACSGWDTCENQEYYAGLFEKANEAEKERMLNM